MKSKGSKSKKTSPTKITSNNSILDTIQDQPTLSENETKELVRNTEDVKTYLKEEYNYDPDLHVDDFNSIILAEIIRRGFSGDQIRSMNTLYTEGIPQIIKRIFSVDINQMENKRSKTEQDRAIQFLSFHIDFTHVELGKPQIMKIGSNKPIPLMPRMARNNNLNYSAPVTVSLNITSTATLVSGEVVEKKEELTGFCIAYVPVMVKSILCNLDGLPRDSLVRLQEDPNDMGGYFILKGTEWVVDKNENLTLNMLHAYHNKYKREVVRGTFQSKPGDAYENSYYYTFRLTTDRQLTVEISMHRTKTLEIPFYVIFRAFGMTRDKDIVDQIVNGIDNTDIKTELLKRDLNDAFIAHNKEFAEVKHTTDPEDILEFLSKKMNDLAKKPNYKRDENAIKYVRNSIRHELDKYIFPHIGFEKEHRLEKLYFLAHLINKLLLVKHGIVDVTDRDALRNKRVHTPGISLGKAFKTQFNFAVVQNIRKNVIQAFNNLSWKDITFSTVVKAAVDPTTTEKVLVQSITTGEKIVVVKQTEINNRVPSQQLIHKNDLNVISTHGNITPHGTSTASGATDRAINMRMINGTYLGYIGIQSSDGGESIGRTKQIACSASIAEASSSFVIRDKIAQDDLVRSVLSVSPNERANMTKIFVNGYWIGCTNQPYEFVRKYRNERRYGNIDKYTTIIWEVKVPEIYFWVDVGRLMRPLVIVYNNKTEYETAAQKSKPIEFKQWVRLTKEHVRRLQTGEYNMDNLVEQRIVEYISAEEQENLLLAHSYAHLLDHKNDPLLQYTHCDIGIAMFGIVELSAPLTNHTQATRITMFTNQKKQTCGWFSLAWPYEIQKNMSLQHYCQMPIVPAFASSLTNSNAQNAIIAYMTYGGGNQEDSIIVNKSSINRGMFNESHFRYEKTELERGEEFGDLSPQNTLNIKKDANYELLQDGFVPVGTRVKKGDILIGKYQIIPKKELKSTFNRIDKSIIYRSDEEGIVTNVIKPKDDEGIQLAKVQIRSVRPLIQGDKLSSHSGCKGIVATLFNSADMPYTADGIIPDIIINPHSIPTRMVIGQIIETMLGILAAKEGRLYDGTPFRQLDLEGAIRTLESYGIKNAGSRKMFNGQTGEWIDTIIFCGPTAYQRLQKFVKDESYAMFNGPSDARTRQPLDGKSSDGGLRIGEMEKDCIIANGVTNALSEKFYAHSDGISIYICRRCGQQAYVNERGGWSTGNGEYRCRRCEDAADIVEVPSSWNANLLFSKLNAMGVKTRFTIDPLDTSRM